MEELKKYVEENIFKEYDKNEEAHGIEHIKTVILRSLELSENLNVDKRLVYVIAAYHDLGHHIDKDKHEIISAKLFMDDEFMKSYFSDSQRQIIKEAIEDHRASSDHVPRSIYGKIVSDSDRTISLDTSLKRSYIYNKAHYNDLSEEKLFEEIYNHFKRKFGESGYIKFYLNDRKNIDALNEIREILKDKNKFIKRLKKVNNL